MIFLDTNCFVRLAVTPASGAERDQALAVARFMRAAANGSKEFTTSDAVLAEVVFVLTSKRGYGRERADVAQRLRVLLSLKGCRSPLRRSWLRALDIWETRNALSFVDALAAAHVEQSGDELGTFDQALRKHPGIKTYRFP